jgi:hypothetical protein
LVFSGCRFLVRGAERGLAIVIVNRGPVRASPGGPGFGAQPS